MPWELFWGGDGNGLILRLVWELNHIVAGVMKMGNTMPRAGLKPTSLAFRASVLPLHHVGSLMSQLYPWLPVYAALCLRGKCGLLQSSPWNCKSINAYNYIIQAVTVHIHTQGRFDNHTAHNFTGSWSWHQCRGCDEDDEYRRHECALLQVGTRSDMTLDASRT